MSNQMSLVWDSVAVTLTVNPQLSTELSGRGDNTRAHNPELFR